MAKLRIMSMELAAPGSRKDEVLDYLQRKGVVELTQPEVTESLSYKDFSPENSECIRKLNVINMAHDILSKLCPVKKPLTAMLEPRKDMSAAEFSLMAEKFGATYNRCEEIVSVNKKKAELSAEIIRKKALIEELRPWTGIDIPLKSGSTKNVAYILGSFRKQFSQEDILTALAKEFPDNQCIETEITSSDENGTCAVIFALKDDIEKIEAVLRSMGFVRAPECSDNTPLREIELLEKAVDDAKKQQEECDEKIRSEKDLHSDIEFAKDYVSICKDKYQAMEKIPESERIFFIKGYIAKRDAEKVKAYLEKNCDAAVSYSDPDENEDVPVILSNNFFSAPLEGITGMYSLPGKFDPDPTGIMAFFYYFFFGMMLSDAGYGLLMVLATGGVLLFKKNLEKKMKNMCLMYFFCGLSTVFWGAMYGSWFGDMINVIRTEFLGLEEVRLYIWMEPVNSLMELMVYCFIFGLVHLFVGVGVKAVSDWRNGDKFGAFCDSVPTYLTILGIAPIFFGLFTEVPPVLSKIGTPVLIVGLILVVLTAGRHSKSLFGKLGGGLYEVYNLIGGYLGDVLSYARLLALGLSTGVIAEVMNMLGVLPSNKILKLIMFIGVAIVGHIANFAINVIGAYVHTNRLQYVEFFGKFYEGGGRAFVPFEAKTNYYKFKEEN
ncbi:MAG: V-type ATP synthase subunit I [Ruminococcaceae bacterium]|nr:V-type ATP synthase subunit I [Oscillospiraceae bacterium]